AQLSSNALRASLVHEVLITAGQPGQPVQYRRLAVGRLDVCFRGEEQGELHAAGEHFRVMLKAQLPTAEAQIVADFFQIHAASPTSRITRYVPPGAILDMTCRKSTDLK